MSTLIRYSHIPLYFCFSITFSTSLIHHYTPPLTWLHMFVHDTHLCFIRPALLIWWTDVLWFTCFISILSSPMCALAQPILNPHTAQSGTYYSFTSDEPCAHFLVYHSYITCLYLPYHWRSLEYKFPPVFRFSVFALPHLTLVLPWLGLGIFNKGYNSGWSALNC